MAVTRRAREAVPLRPRRTRLWVVLALLLLVGALVGLWFLLPVRTVRVSGNHFLTAAQVQQLSGLSPKFGWLYYGAWRARDLARSPWVRAARITRHFPDTVEVLVTERVPSAQLLQGDHFVAMDWDGTVLPHGPLRGPQIVGWGPNRLNDAIRAARLMARYNVQSVTYTPQGMTVKTAQGTAWSGSYASLRKYGVGVRMYPGKRVNIYPWGVSVQE